MLTSIILINSGTGYLAFIIYTSRRIRMCNVFIEELKLKS
jgi:hypothetical protein